MMPTPPKALDSMTKNLTAEERVLREQAEKGVIPDRGREVTLERPAIMTKNAAAGRYWKKVLDRMRGLVILDDLDSDALGVYCVMMARYEQQCKLLALVSKQLKEAKVGLTPSGRIRLAQKRAEQAAQTDPDGDLFGD